MRRHESSPPSYGLLMLSSMLLFGVVLIGCAEDETHTLEPATAPVNPTQGVVAAASEERDPSPTETSVVCEVKAQATAAAQSTGWPRATIEHRLIDYEWAADYSKKEILVSDVDNVFIGRVRSMGDTFSLLGGMHDTWTPYAVKVEEVLLGDVSGEITVVQHGGFDCGHDWLVRVRGDRLLDVGRTYLLATNADHNAGENRDSTQHILVPIFGRFQIDSDTRRQELIEEFTEAIQQAGLDS